jgi:hypothetical protein
MSLEAEMSGVAVVRRSPGDVDMSKEVFGHYDSADYLKTEGGYCRIP